MSKLFSGAMLVWLIATGASAEDAAKPYVVFDRDRGELSPGTSAPSRQELVNTIKSATPMRLYATLEYGERVECFECIPLLADKLLSSDDAEVREISAWWLRRRPFGFAPIVVRMRRVAASDPDPVKRARAAEALGEFLDPHAQPTLSAVATSDAEASVRASAVRALGRLNTTKGHAALIEACDDADPKVRKAALDQVLKVNFWSGTSALLGRLADDDAGVRRTAAQLVGTLKIGDALEPLLGLLITDDSADVRSAAAIALGRIGGPDAAAALVDARKLETDSSVQDAISVASKMK